MQSRIKTKQMTLCAVLTSLAIIFSYIEMLIPFHFGIPGMKLGLANLVVIIALYLLGGGYAFSINLIRMILVALLFGGLAGMLYSLSGGILSFCMMYTLKRVKVFSIVGVSMAGGVMHNMGQLIIAALIVENVKILLILPFLLFSGMVTGICIGVVAYYSLGRVVKLM